MSPATPPRSGSPGPHRHPQATLPLQGPSLLGAGPFSPGEPPSSWAGRPPASGPLHLRFPLWESLSPCPSRCLFPLQSRAPASGDWTSLGASPLRASPTVLASCSACLQEPAAPRLPLPLEVIPARTGLCDSLLDPLPRLFSVAQPCLTLCGPMNARLPVLHRLPEFAQTHAR